MTELERIDEFMPAKYGKYFHSLVKDDKGEPFYWCYISISLYGPSTINIIVGKHNLGFSFYDRYNIKGVTNGYSAHHYLMYKYFNRKFKNLDFPQFQGEGKRKQAFKDFCNQDGFMEGVEEHSLARWMMATDNAGIVPTYEELSSIITLYQLRDI